MQELAGRLTALDPEASESLKVISYFDALVAAGAGMESLVRAAAVLSGVTAGVQVSTRRIRVDASGRRVHDTDGADDEGVPREAVDGNGLRAPGAGPRVWIERAGQPHANDAMILDRLSLAVAIVDGRRNRDTGALEVVLDPDKSTTERAAAIGRLGLGASGALRVWAFPPDAEELPPGRSALLAGVHGLVRAVVSNPGDLAQTGRAGHALARDAERLPNAWRDARMALRLSDRRHPIIDADGLGALIELAHAREADRQRPPHPDVAVLRGLDARARDLLDELVEAESVRAAASALGMHHSSLQTRHESLTRLLGYDPRSPLGRTRYEAARLLSRLA